MKALWLIAALAAAGSQADPPAAPPAAADAPAPPAAPTETSAAPTKPLARLDLRRAHAPAGDAQAGKGKSEVCSACHGADGIAITPAFPNLAGQKADYLYWALHAYKDGRMPESPMTPMAAPLEEQDIRDLAAYYASLPHPPPPADAAPADPPDPALLSQGQAIYMDGDVSQGIPPCQGCHGADARGNPQASFKDRSGRSPYAAYPVLRGQQNDYLQARLQQFHDNTIDASTNSRVMHGIGRQLDADSIKAVSTWLSSLKE
ncbi:MAG: c-type cytochrome [Stenotrophomonas sp.]